MREKHVQVICFSYINKLKRLQTKCQLLIIQYILPSAAETAIPPTNLTNHQTRYAIMPNKGQNSQQSERNTKMRELINKELRLH